MSSSMKDQIKKTQTARPAKTAQTGAVAKAPFKRPSGRASFPRRMTLDLDDARFDWLRQEAYQARIPAAALLRAAIDAMESEATLRKRIVDRARKDHPAP